MKFYNFFLVLFVMSLFLVHLAYAEEKLDDLSRIELGLLEGDNEEVKDNPDIIRYKNAKNTNLNWSNVNVKEFLSLSKWIQGRDAKDLFPDWENIVRERKSKEIIGHFYQCVGECRIDRAESFFNARFRTNIYEGDEVSTLPDSYAWVFLLDGTMIRIAPESSISLNEINIGIKENFIMARLNFGNVLWLSRTENEYTELNERETDQLFIPPVLFEANSVKDNKKYDLYNLLNYIEEPETNLNQYKRLNELILANNNLTKAKKTFAYIVCPAITIMGYAPQVEIISLLGGKTYVKNKSSEEMGFKTSKENEVEFQLRGYENKELKKLEEAVWFEVDETGRHFDLASDNSLKIVGEFLTKRIPSLMIARELLMKDYSKILFQEKYDRLVLARDEGYRLWGSINSVDDTKSDLNLRLTYLKEYFRRVETSNLLMSKRFRERIVSRGEKLKNIDYGSHFFSRALEEYFTNEEYSDENESGEVLNSTKKKVWKMMHGLK